MLVICLFITFWQHSDDSNIEKQKGLVPKEEICIEPDIHFGNKYFCKEIQVRPYFHSVSDFKHAKNIFERQTQIIFT